VPVHSLKTWGMKVDGQLHQGCCTPRETVCSTNELGVGFAKDPVWTLREEKNHFLLQGLES